MTTYSAPAELDALPVGTQVLDRFSEGGPGLAYWTKGANGNWHLIEQVNPDNPEDTWPDAGTDWSPAEGDPTENVLINGPVKAVLEAQK